MQFSKFTLWEFCSHRNFLWMDALLHNYVKEHSRSKNDSMGMSDSESIWIVLNIIDFVNNAIYIFYPLTLEANQKCMGRGALIQQKNFCPHFQCPYNVYLSINCKKWVRFPTILFNVSISLHKLKKCGLPPPLPFWRLCIHCWSIFGIG